MKRCRYILAYLILSIAAIGYISHSSICSHIDLIEISSSASESQESAESSLEEVEYFDFIDVYSAPECTILCIESSYNQHWNSRISFSIWTPPELS